jgi:hypothetical protein
MGKREIASGDEGLGEEMAYPLLPGEGEPPVSPPPAAAWRQGVFRGGQQFDCHCDVVILRRSTTCPRALRAGGNGGDGR